MGKMYSYRCEICDKPYDCRRKWQRTCSNACAGQIRSGPANPHWKGGCVSRYGYRLICVNGKQVLEHRYLMEQHLGRSLERSEVIHHRDGNKLNNDLSNLELLPSNAAHKTRHFLYFRNETHKECSRCRLVKTRSDFSPSTNGNDPNRNYCKQCFAEIARRSRLRY
jgi:hypothetical protein